MQRTTLGRTDISVSRYCLGTMTFGTQTPEDAAHAQIDMALDHGIDFLDSAEMYPVNPVRAETVGRSEAIIGNWIARTGRRADLVIATKISGAGSHSRGGAPITGGTIPQAVEGSLRRLQTDHIDLYQLHWPNRAHYMFRQNWSYDASQLDPSAEIANFEDCLGALAREVEKGRIRAVGLSNETCWGTLQWLAAADRTGGPRIATMQNEYSLLCRLYDTDMAEMSIAEQVSLIPFSPLAAGFLSGKYQGETVPEKSRMSLNPEMGGRNTPRVRPAVAAYLDIAARHGLDPVHMALAFTLSRPFVASTIFGATTTGQLAHVLDGTDLALSQEVLADIDAAHFAHPLPY